MKNGEHKRLLTVAQTYPVHGNDDEEDDMVEHARHHPNVPAVLKVVQLIGKHEDIVEIQQVEAVVRHRCVQPPLSCS